MSECDACAASGAPEAVRCSTCGEFIRLKGYPLRGRLPSRRAHQRLYRASSPSGEVLIKGIVLREAPNAAALDRLQSEETLLRRLGAEGMPRFVAAFETGQGQDHARWLVQSYVPGRSLELAETLPFVDESQARKLASAVLKVLSHLHSRSPRVVHRSVTPANILMGPEDAFSLVGFGDATIAGPLRGQTPWEPEAGFCPPAWAAREPHPRIDLFGLGATLVQLLAHRAAWEMAEPNGQLNYRRWVNVSAAFSDFIDTLLATEDGSGFSCAAEALERLQMLPRPLFEAEPTSPSIVTPAEVLREAPAPERVPDDDRRDLNLSWVLTFRGQELLLEPGRSYLVGRSSRADLCIPEGLPGASRVSREHLRLRVEGTRLVLEDLKSSNGTVVGNELLCGRRKYVLQDVAVLALAGKVELQVAPRLLSVSPLAPPSWSRLEPRSTRRGKLVNHPGGDPEGARIYRFLRPDEN